jgi:hypothetical protein
VNVLDTLACEVVSYTSRRPWAYLEAWGIQALYFNANGDDARFEAEHELIAVECDRRRVAFCIWFNVPRETTGGRKFAETCSKRVTELGGAARVAAVMFDNEKVPLEFQDDYMPRWDELRPWRDTLYSVEPGQDETQNRYATMLARNPAGLKTLGRRVRKVTFQNYHDKMQPLDPLEVRTNSYGPARVPDDELCPTIDPAQPAPYIASAAACGLRGLMLFESGRIP